MSKTAFFRITVTPAGWQYEAAPDVSLVIAARRAGIRLPSSCRNGTCRACICRLEHGELCYRGVRPGLSADEREEGWILPCVAHARSDVTIAVPHAREIEPVPAAQACLTGARR